MKIDEIKNKILQLAIQGNLVPQDENDESATVLLQRIKAEKKELIKEKKIKKEKPFPEISEEEKMFELPEGWEWCRLVEIGDIVGGGTPSSSVKEYYSDYEIPWLTPADLRGYKEKYISNGSRYITQLGLEKSSAQMLPKGSVLFSSRAPIGYVVIADNDICTNQGFKSIVPFEMNMNEYLYYCLKCITPSIEEKAAGTTFKEISGSGMKSIVIPLPPLEEQKRIVAKVDELFAIVDELGENKEAMANCITDTRNKVLQLAIQGKLVEQDAEDEPASVLLERIREEKEKLIKEKKIMKEKTLPEISEEEKTFEIPEGWEWCRLGTVVNINGRKSVSPDNIDDDVWTLEMEDIEKGTSRILNRIYNRERKVSSNKNVFEKSDVLYGKLRPYLNKVLVADASGVCSSEILPIQPFEIESKYIKEYLKSGFYLNYANGLTAGVRMPRLGTEDIRKAVFPVPPLAEQKRIVAKIDQVMVYLDHLEQVLLA